MSCLPPKSWELMGLASKAELPSSGCFNPQSPECHCRSLERELAELGGLGAGAGAH